MTARDGRPLVATDTSTPLCVIGASAGGIAALQALFRALPNDLGLAYIVVIHLSPEQPSTLPEILADCTAMPVAQVEDAPRLEPDRVYVIPPDRELTIADDEVAALPFAGPRGQRSPIDRLLRSMADARGDGIAVVLSGAGSDGASGVRAVKEVGGIVMAQDPAEAAFPSMPQSVIATGSADFIAPAARLAEHVAKVARSKGALVGVGEDEAAGDLRGIIGLLRQRTGHDFLGYKRATVLRRVARRMQIRHVPALADYAAMLREVPEEAEALFADLLISVTQFFRDPAAFEALRRHAVHPLLKEQAGGDGVVQVRAWVVGCATGEEAYSLAILMLEEAARLRVRAPIQIFATDLDERALRTAREGRYPRSIESQVSPERLRRYFVDEGTRYRASPELRELVLFAPHSVVREPPFMRLDLVVCRNVLIYMERPLQQQALEVFHYALRPERILFLGSAETADTAPGHFAPLDREARLYRARPRLAATPPLMATASLPNRAPAPPPRPFVGQSEAGEVLGPAHAEALEGSAPPSALVDAEHATLHLSSSAGRFILFSAGPPSAKLPAIIRPELRLGLQAALDRAFETGQPTVTPPVQVRFDDARHTVTLHVALIPAAVGAAARALVCFLDHGVDAGADRGPPAAADTTALDRLHGELKAAQDRAAAMRHDHDAVIQDLRAANEELQSLNEEYRSTAEELETSKEELQSINEELQAVNAELKIKLTVISDAHNDLLNLNASSEIGTLFLDTELRIRMFTPPVAELFNVAEGDAGRAITDFTHRLDYEGLERDVRRVMRELTPIEEEVRDREGRWFLVRLRPYRTLDHRVEGAVVTFDDISGRKRAEVALREGEARLRAFVTASADVVYRTNADWSELEYVEGRAFIPSLHRPSTGWIEAYVDEADRPQVRAAIDAAVRDGTVFELEHRIRRLDGSFGWILSRAVPIRDPAGAIVEWIGTASDVTARREAEAALRASEERLRLMTANLPSLVWQADAKGEVMFSNQRWTEYTGQTADAVQHFGWLDAIHPDDREDTRQAFVTAFATGEPLERRQRICRADGAYRWFLVRHVPARDGDGRVMRWYGVATDVHDLLDGRGG